MLVHLGADYKSLPPDLAITAVSGGGAVGGVVCVSKWHNRRSAIAIGKYGSLTLPTALPSASPSAQSVEH